jgi:hypothetical protein
MSGLWWGSLRPWTLSPRHKTQTQTLAAEEPDSTAAQEPDSSDPVPVIGKAW